MRFIDLYAGIGGFRMALENLGGECVLSAEWNKYARETYSRNFKINHPYEIDVTCLLYTSPSPRDRQKSRMPSSA